jgi:hypothetical protein
MVIVRAAVLTHWSVRTQTELRQLEKKKLAQNYWRTKLIRSFIDSSKHLVPVFYPSYCPSCLFHPGRLPTALDIVLTQPLTTETGRSLRVPLSCLTVTQASTRRIKRAVSTGLTVNLQVYCQVMAVPVVSRLCLEVGNSMISETSEAVYNYVVPSQDPH